MMQLESKNSFVFGFLESMAKSVTRRYNVNRLSRRSQPSIAFKLAKSFCIDRKKRELGLDRCTNLLTAAAPMSAELKNYFLSLDLALRNKCGMTELTVFCISMLNSPLDSVGKPLDHVEAKILNPDTSGQGEICVKGRNVFMGYLNDVEKTREAIDNDRWLHTGDYGKIDSDGRVYITGRLKEIIITSGGENVPPVRVENLVKAECNAISNAFLVGDNKKYLNILITLKTEVDEKGFPTDDLTVETQKWLETLNLSYTKLGDILNHPKVLQAIQEAINRANENAISNAQRVQKFSILPRDFSFATGELGPTMKLKRNVVTEKYRNVIEKFYEE
jgi:long-chain-fatty-acid--CoA ligase ACSBG